MTVTALIVAAGSGQRLGGDLPKQYRSIGGKPMVRHAVEALIGHPRIDAVRVVIGEGQEDRPTPRSTGSMSASRSSAVQRAPTASATDSRQVGEGIVLVHDAARPFCPPSVIDRLLDALDDNDGAVPALPIADTLATGGSIC